MGLTIILSTVVPIVLTLFFVMRFLGGMQREQQQTQLLLQNGMPADGRVLSLMPTGQSVTVIGARNIRVAGGLEGHLPGRPPYQVQVMPLVSELLIPSIQPGASVSLRVDPNNPGNV